MRSCILLYLGLAFLIVFAAALPRPARAQSGEARLSGLLLDAVDSIGVVGANVVVIDTSGVVRGGAVSAADGSFDAQLTGIDSARYLIRIQLAGYQTIDRQARLWPGRHLHDTLFIKPYMIDAIDVEGAATPVLQKGDTTIYNAEAFQTTPDASVGALLEKLPGMGRVNGQLKANGENVEKILVDGKPYFGQDGEAALNNLPAEAVDKVQVLDQKTDKAQTTGFDEGETNKTVNIITKPEFAEGNYGKLFAGGGTDERYRGGGVLNINKQQHRWSIIGTSNNVNQTRLSTKQLLNVAENLGDEGGVTTTHAFGTNYTGSWGKHIEVQASYRGVYNERDTEERFVQQFVSRADSGQVYDESTQSVNENQEHRFRSRFEYFMDSSNYFLWRPRYSLNLTDSELDLTGNTSTPEGPLRNTLTQRSSDLTRLTLDNFFVYTHRFRKSGRIFSGEFSHEHRPADGDARLVSTQTSFNGNLPSDSLNQRSATDNREAEMEVELNWIEPVSKHGKIRLVYEGSRQPNTIEEITHRELGRVENGVLDSSLSSDYRSELVTHEARADYNLKKEKLSATLSLSYVRDILEVDQRLPGPQDSTRRWNNLLPTFFLKYDFTKMTSLRIYTRASTLTPPVPLLQDRVDNSNPLLLSTGNPALNINRSYFAWVRFRKAMPKTRRSFMASYRLNVIDNSFATNTIIPAAGDTIVRGIRVPEGGQLSFPVSLDGFISSNLDLNYSFPLSPLQSTLSLQAGYSYRQTPGQLNGERNLSKTHAPSSGFTLSSNVSKKVDFTLRTRADLNFVQNSLSRNVAGDFWQQNSSLRAQWTITDGFYLSANLQHNRYEGLDDDFVQDFLRWNAAAGLKFLDRNRGDLRLTVFDLLDQNRIAGRSIGDISVTDRRANTLTRFVMLTFTYQFRNFSGESVEKTDAERGKRRGTWRFW